MVGLRTIGVVAVLILIGFFIFPMLNVCGYNGKSYNNVYEANYESKFVQGFGNCVQTDVVTIKDTTTQYNPVEKTNIVERFVVGVYQILSYPVYWVVK